VSLERESAILFVSPGILRWRVEVSPDKSLCQFSGSFEIGRARVAERALAHPAVASCAICLRPDAGELWEKNSRTFRVASISMEGSRSARLDRETLALSAH
jgi:hypothetical protein